MLIASHLRNPSRERTYLLPVIGALSVVAWVGLMVWSESPYGRYLHHESPGGLATPLELGLFTGGWVLMIVAMMLPTTVPLLATFRALVSRRHRPGLLLALAVAGYLLTWVGFGVAAWVADRAVHAVVNAVPWLAQHPHVILAATFAAAGAYQFSSLKYRCLDECRSPLGFVLNRWRGRNVRFEALRLGIAHGLFCIGCCWSLMLVMFGVGLGSIAWMLVVGAITSIEKNVAWGRRLGRPLGVVLLLAGLAVLNG